MQALDKHPSSQRFVQHGGHTGPPRSYVGLDPGDKSNTRRRRKQPHVFNG